MRTALQDGATIGRREGSGGGLSDSGVILYLVFEPRNGCRMTGHWDPCLPLNAKIVTFRTSHAATVVGGTVL